MRNVRYIFVLLLLINCTTGQIEDTEVLDSFSTQSLTQTCLDDLPEVRLVNNGTHNFDFIIYGQDYTVLHSQSITSTANSGWIEMPTEGIVIVVVTNDIVYGQKMEVNLGLCDNLELEINSNNILVGSGE